MSYFVTPWTAAHQASLSITNSQSLLKLISIELVIPSDHLSSVVPFSSCLQSFPASGFFQMTQLFASGGQNIGVSALASVLPMNIQDWFPLGWTGWISLLSKGLSSLLQHHSSKASILWCSAFFVVQLSHPYMTTGKTIALTRWTLVGKVMSLLFNMLSRLVITFLPRSKRVNFMAAATICSDSGAPKNSLPLFPLFPRRFAMNLMWRVDSLEKTLMLGGIGGRRRRGWQRMMAGWHHRLDGRESEWTLGVGDGQGGLACCDSWGREESDTTERLIFLVQKLVRLITFSCLFPACLLSLLSLLPWAAQLRRISAFGRFMSEHVLPVISSRVLWCLIFKGFPWWLRR